MYGWSKIPEDYLLCISHWGAGHGSNGEEIYLYPNCKQIVVKWSAIHPQNLETNEKVATEYHQRVSYRNLDQSKLDSLKEFLSTNVKKSAYNSMMDMGFSIKYYPEVGKPPIIIENDQDLYNQALKLTT